MRLNLRRPVTMPAWAAATAAVGLLVVGSAIATDTPVEEVTATDQVDEVVEVVTETVTEEPSTGAAADASEVAVERARLDEVDEQLGERKSKLDQRKDRLDERKAALDDREAELDAQVQTLADLPAPNAGAAEYYENCSAAIDAGDAPVYEGDPGYGRHLDRDGDGVGCEY